MSQEAPPPFFVVGADRSGTTLLRLYLDANSNLAIPSESWFLIDLLERFGPRGVLDADGVSEALAIVSAHPRFVDGWHVDLARLRRDLRPNAPLRLAELVDALFRAETHAPAEVTWGDKTPEYVGHLPALASCFPGARFVNIVRDGRDVYLSLATRRWSDRGYTPYELGRYWSSCVAAAREAGRELGERYLEVRYEDLVLETPSVLQRVCDFLGVTFEEAMLAAHDRASLLMTTSEREAGVHDKLSRPPRPSDVGRWRDVRTGLSSLRLAAGVMAGQLSLAGYRDAPPPLPSAALRGLAAGDHFYRRRLRPRLRRIARRLGAGARGPA